MGVSAAKGPLTDNIRARVNDSLGHVGYTTIGDRKRSLCFARLVQALHRNDAFASALGDDSKNDMNDLIETTQKVASQALSYVSKLQDHVHQFVYLPGEYFLTRDAALTESPSMGSHMIEVIPSGSAISVVEVCSIADEGRVRGRVKSASGGGYGYVTLRFGQHVFARRVGEIGDAVDTGSSNLSVDDATRIDVKSDSLDEYAERRSLHNKPKVDTFEATWQLASHAIGFMKAELGMVKTWNPSSDKNNDDLTPGAYVLLQEAAVTEDLQFDSARIDVFLVGTSVHVLEIIDCPQENRIRGRIKVSSENGDGEGFITLRYAEHAFARRVASDTRAPKE